MQANSSTHDSPSDFANPPSAEASQETRAQDAAADESQTKDQPKKPEIDVLTAYRLMQLETKVKEYEEKISGIREYVKKQEAEVVEVRARASRDLEKNLTQKISQFFNELLPIVDNFERSLKTAEKEEGPLADGVRLIHQQFSEFLKRSGLTRIVTKGEAFNPTIHEALTTVSVQDAAQDGLVIEEVKAGYRLNDKIVRPAQVIVGTNS